MKKLVIAMLMVGLAASSAYAFNLGGYEGPISIKFADYTVGRGYEYDSGFWYPEGARSGLPTSTHVIKDGVDTPDPGSIEDSWGIITVTSINPLGDDSNTLWYSGKDTGDGAEYINGYIYGFDDIYIKGNSATDIDIAQVGGFIDLYLGSNGLNSDPSPNLRGSSTNVYNIDTTGTKFFRVEAVPGVVPGKNYTRWENFDGFTRPYSGDGSGYFSVDEGWGEYDDVVLNGTMYHSDPDLYAIFDFRDQGNKLFDAKSDDPASNMVPEPASMLLLGMGLVGLVAAGRKRKAA